MGNRQSLGRPDAGDAAEKLEPAGARHPEQPEWMSVGHRIEKLAHGVNLRDGTNYWGQVSNRLLSPDLAKPCQTGFRPLPVLRVRVIDGLEIRHECLVSLPGHIAQN